MRKWLSSLTLNQRLAALAFVLGAIALAARPYPGASVRIDARELASMVTGDVALVEPLVLADWIVAGRGDFRLIDLRDATAFATYHVPGAEQVAATALADYPLLRNEIVVLYSEDDVRAAQAWFLMKATGYRSVYILAGGLDGWVHTVLFPTLSGDPSQKTRDDSLAALSAHFGGRPKNAGEAVAAAFALPQVVMPASGPVAPKKKKKKEGC